MKMTSVRIGNSEWETLTFNNEEQFWQFWATAQSDRYDILTDCKTVWIWVTVPTKLITEFSGLPLLQLLLPIEVPPMQVHPSSTSH